VIGHPLETTVALHYLIFDGVLERYPNLKILAVHGGGYLASYAGRMDHAWGARSDSRGRCRTHRRAISRSSTSTPWSSPRISCRTWCDSMELIAF
jgi:predicted TIM-barrel fold metal-dependent hydrolase